MYVREHIELDTFVLELELKNGLEFGSFVNEFDFE